MKAPNLLILGVGCLMLGGGPNVKGRVPDVRWGKARLG